MISYVVDLEAITFKPTYDAWAKDPTPQAGGDDDDHPPH